MNTADLLKTPAMHEEANLFDETAEMLVANGKTWADVQWIGSLNGQYAVTDSKAISDVLNIDYDSGHGLEEIALDLVIVGENWWLERHDYDGAEWWEFKSTPKIADEPQIFKVISRRQRAGKYYNGAYSIEEMNGSRS